MSKPAFTLHRIVSAPVLHRQHPVIHAFDRFAGAATRQAGSATAFVLAVGVVMVWAITGPIFSFSETWQLVINTGTTIITFLMVFLIQQSQNKDAVAVHLKLNELLASHKEASNMLVSIEDLDEQELRQLITFYRQLAQLAEGEGGLKCSHSLDEARENHEAKHRARAVRPTGGGDVVPGGSEIPAH
ncbi:low affinity iron permease family protein [Cupriavidus basilensis]|uniref:low affinity iron permease family protein n=1 Tax=Cupriavidus basilensis TaxID=68895 RepID=UPI0023E84BB9|nr:low affinity iron permease family protein [Cupriavidus basilensis]MDF3883144.1 low affinity iron permease family protein [Cupriavidus basilensis]